MKTSVRIAAALALVIAGQAWAASTVAYTVEIGGDPQASVYESGSYPQYIRGGTTELTVAQNATVNWDVVVTVSGTHSGVLGDGLTPAGLANAVFTLELKDAAGSVVQLGHATTDAHGVATGGGWYSVINDGDADGTRGALLGSDPLQNAAYPTVFNINSNMAKGGRLFDVPASGGPNVNFYHYPSCTNLPAAAANCGGKLIGMGAGYSSFMPIDAGGLNMAGVGLTGSSGDCAGLGEKALFEGQISTIGLGTGTYTLHVIPGSGTNILPQLGSGYDLCFDGPTGQFAVQPNTVTDSLVTFVIQAPPTLVVTPSNQNVAETVGQTAFSVTNAGTGTLSYTSATGASWLHIISGGSGTAPGVITVNYDANGGAQQRVGTITVTAAGAAGSPQNVTVTQAGSPCQSLAILSSNSIKTHGTYGPFPVASGGWEGRMSGTNTGPTQVKTVFNQAIHRVNNTAADFTLSSGTLGTVTITTTTVANDTLTVNLTAVTNRAIFTIAYPGIAADCGNSTVATTNCWVVMGGEVNGGTSLLVNTSDYVTVRGQLNKPITSANFRSDVNSDGVINTSDYVTIRGKLSTTTMAPTCP